MKISKKTITSDLNKIGIKKGDVLLVTSNLGVMTRGMLSAEEVLHIFLEILGKEGTLVVPSYTPSFYSLKKSNYTFTMDAPSKTGALSNAMLQHPDSIRSRHPTNSVVAIGKKAHFIVSGHNESSAVCEAVQKLIHLNAKMISIGISSRNFWSGGVSGFPSIHVVENELGLSKRRIFPWLQKVHYISEKGKRQVFRRSDRGLCTKSNWKFYSYYIRDGFMIAAYVGNAYTLLINSKISYEIEKKILSTNPKFHMCDDIDCMQCNLLRWDNIHNAPRWLFKKILNRCSKFLKQLRFFK
jgi:aminoglycoside 3-N-acetyltransferase